MKRILTAILLIAAFALSVAAEDWYHEREERFRGEGWRSQVFVHVRTDLDHIWSASRAAERERARLDRTKQELTELQAKLDHNRFDNGELNDVIDSIRKSSDDDRLSPRDRGVLRDDLGRLKDYQDNHNHWRR
jgi:opacity protein-like surface antigen